MSEIPIEVKNLMKEFLASQKEQEAKKALEKQRTSVGEVDLLVRKPMKPQEVIRYAREFGFSVDSGGRHGVHIVAPNGSACPLPVHGGGKTLATGTQRSIVSFIQQNGVYRS